MTGRLQDSEQIYANCDGILPPKPSQPRWRKSLQPLATTRAHESQRLGTRLARIDEETVPTMLRPVHRASAGFVLTTLCLGACVVHDPEPAFRAAVLIDDRGISIPLPPPSLTDEPEQEVDVDGEVIGLPEGPTSLVVHIVDGVGGAELDVPLAEGAATFHGEGLAIDLSNNCIELWLEDADGHEGEHAQYHAVIDASGQSIEVAEGCD
jgi:hypothetical protein